MPKAKMCNLSLPTRRPTVQIQKRQKFQHNSSITCESSNLIYVITCSGCGEHYIGQTGDTLRHRMTVHRQQIRETKYQCTAVSGHLRNCAKTLFRNLQCVLSINFIKQQPKKNVKQKKNISFHYINHN